MIHMERRLVIARPRDEVFDYVANLDHLAAYIGPIESIQGVTTRSLRKGTRLTITAHFLGIHFSQRAECVEHAPPSRFVARSVGGRFYFEAGFEMLEEEGKTVMLGWGKADAPRLFPLAEAILGFFVERQIDGDLKKLKRILEAR
jgi:uncharacterized membrane protein